MPRVSEQYRAARRAGIVLAASRLFAANGFYSTSMDDIIAAAGLSSGALYGYFRSKEEIIGAVAENALRTADETFGQLLADGATPSPAQAVMTVIENLVMPSIDGAGTGREASRIALQVWAEALRNPELKRLSQDAFGRLRAQYALVAGKWQAAGHLPPDSEPDQVAVVMLSLTQGFLMQHLVTDVDLPTYRAGVWALLDAPDHDR